MDFATALGFTGVAILLAAFLLNLTGKLPAEGAPYLALNLVGAALAAWSSWLIQFMPFVLLEGTWALVAAFGLFRTLGRRTTPRRPAA